MARYYNLKANTLVIGGVVVSGFGDDGGIEYENNSELVELSMGADGDPTFSELNDDTLIATITLKESSPSYRALAELLKTQLTTRRTTGTIDPLAYLHRDPVNGDIVQCFEAVFMSRPTPSKGRTAGDREFKIALPHAAADALYGSKNFL